MIREVNNEEVKEAQVSKRGPRTKKTQMAQQAVEEFLESGLDAAEVDWRAIDPDWTMAKRAIAYRINHSQYSGLPGADDLGMRSNRDEEKVYLVRTSKFEG